MAITGSLITMLVSLFIVAITMVSAAGDTQALKSPTAIPENEHEDSAPTPAKTQHYYLFLHRCVKKLTVKCGDKFYLYMMRNKNYPVSKKCCQMLMYVGRKCHDTIAEALFSLGDPSRKSKSRAISWSAMIWNKCAAVTSSPAPSPY